MILLEAISLSSSRRTSGSILVAGFLIAAIAVSGCSEETGAPADEPIAEADQLLESSSPADTTEFARPGDEADDGEIWPYGFDATTGGLEATVLALGEVRLDADGRFAVEPTPTMDPRLDEFSSGDWSYELTAASIGRTDRQYRLDEPTTATHRPSEATFEYRDRQTDVVWQHQPDGMKLHVDIHEQPAGEGPVEVVFDQRADGLELQPDDDGLAALYRDREVFRWTAPVAYDDRGDSLPVAMEQAEDTLEFTVDDTDATYPITIDPLATSPDWSFFSSQSDSRFGDAVATGDVNDNGHTDILVSQPGYTGNVDDQGRVLLFAGSPDGPSNSADAIIAGDEADEQFGAAVAMEANFTGDGCDELVVGAPGYDDDRGRVFHYQLHDCDGGDDFDTSLLWTQQGEGSDEFGRSVEIGDFNCNGGDDLVVGAPGRDGEYEEDGELYSNNGGVDIYYGETGGDGLEQTPGFSYHGDEDDARLGQTLKQVPEYDGRTYDTPERCEAFAAGAPARDNHRGAIEVLYQETDGDFETPPVRIEGTDVDDTFGRAVATLPSPEGTEIDGHTLSALAVGAPGTDDTDSTGYVELYEYSDQTGNPELVWDQDGPHSGSRFGASVAGDFDVNDDDHADLAVGAPGYDAETDDGAEGGVLLYLGAPDELLEQPERIIDSGQSDSGFGAATTAIADYEEDRDALLVGASHYDGLVADAGKAFVYPGQTNCYIDGTFYSDGDVNPQTPCQFCDVEEATQEWTNEDDGVQCDQVDCDVWTCQDGVCEETDQVDCDDGNPCTDNYCEDGDCFADPDPMEDESCGDGQFGCTSEVCEAGDCVETVDTGCLIDDACWTAGDHHPSADCFECNPDESTDSWTPRDEGESCDNGLFCTVGDTCDGAGQCVAGDERNCEPVQCHGDVECSNSSSACQPVDPQTGPDCDVDDGLSCTAGTCESGSCEANLVDDRCLIDGACYQEGDVAPGDDCKHCDPTTPHQWSDRDDGTSCEPADGLECTSGACAGGTCQSSVDDGWCFIDGECFESGDENPTNVCQVCDPTDAQQAWSAGNEGVECSGRTCADDNQALPPSTCQAGSCEAPTETEDCGLYVCDDEAGECLVTCEDDDDCFESAWCNDDDECTNDPVADAGDDQTVGFQQPVTLDGTDSFDPLEQDLDYDWSQTDGADVELSGADSATPDFTAPATDALEDGDTELELTFELVVEADDRTSEADETTVTVGDEDNTPPVAVIEGPDEAVAGDTVTLDGNESYDPDGGDIADYQWTYVAGDPLPTIAQTDVDHRVDVTFPEDLEEPTVYTVGLVVNDGMTNSAITEHDVFVVPTDAGDDVGVPTEPQPDAGVPTDTGDDDPAQDGELGGSGCACTSTGGGDPLSMAMFAVFALMVVGGWRRRGVVV